MTSSAQQTMRAAAIDRFGGVEQLGLREVAVPQIGPDEVSIRLEVAGVGTWDAFEREGGYAELLGKPAAFPYVLGSEGAGIVTAVGASVRGFARGERVYASGFLNPKGGLYAEYVAVPAELVAPIPPGLSMEQAGVLAGVGLTALRGLEDTLQLSAGQSLLVLGAGGGIGHIAIQLAKSMGARVLAVASGKDGVALAQKLEAEVAIDGREEDVVAAGTLFAPAGIDAALVTAGGDSVAAVFEVMREGGRVAYPTGVEPLPEPPANVQLLQYNAEPDGDLLRRLQRWIAAGPFHVHVARTFPLEQAADAHRALEHHYLGKLALRISE